MAGTRRAVVLLAASRLLLLGLGRHLAAGAYAWLARLAHKGVTEGVTEILMELTEDPDTGVFSP